MLEAQVIGIWWVGTGVFAIAGAIVGQSKNRTTHGALLGFFLGPIGLLIACMLEWHDPELSHYVRPAPLPPGGPITGGYSVPAPLPQPYPMTQEQLDLREQERRTREGMIAAMEARKKRG